MSICKTNRILLTFGLSMALPFAGLSQSMRAAVLEATASGTYSESSPMLAFDGQRSTGWLADRAFDATFEFYLQVRLGDRFCPHTLNLSEPDYYFNNGRCPKHFRLLGSTDGESWSVVLERENVAWTSVSQSFPIQNADSYSYFKFVFVEPTGSSNYAFGLGEWEMDGLFDHTVLEVSDLIARARSNAPENPFRTSSCTAASGDVANLFDGSNAATLQAGRLLIDRTQVETAFVQIEFTEDALAGGMFVLTDYGLRMDGTDSMLQAVNRMPKEWKVLVSDKASPTANDWTPVDEQKDVLQWPKISGEILGRDFVLGDVRGIRAVRLEFGLPTGQNQYLQLSEVRLNGFVISGRDERTDFVLSSSSVTPLRDGTAEAAAVMLPYGSAPGAYDLFCVVCHDDRCETNRVASGLTAIGTQRIVLPGLKLATDYVARLFAVNASGTVTEGEAIPFKTQSEVFGSSIPGGMAPVEYIESTAGGGQYVNCQFAPSGKMGFEADFILYNALVNSKTWTGGTDGYGILFGELVGGQYTRFYLATATGGSGTYPTGLFIQMDAAKQAYITPGQRMTAECRNGIYTAVCGTTTNVSNVGAATFSGCISLYGFCQNNGGTPAGNSVARLYSFKVYDEAETPAKLSHDFVPAVDADGVGGLYDVVTETWCPNLVATPFVVGEAKVEETFSVSVVSFSGRALTVSIVREGTEAADVTAVFGPTYGGVKTDAWAKSAACSRSFAAGATSGSFKITGLTADDRYVRFKVGANGWTPTVYLPDLKASVGTMILVQ